MQPGFIKLYRKVFDHALWKESRSLTKFEAWLDLLQLAAFAPSKRFINGQFIEIAEGECIASLRYLGQRWQWSKNKVATFLAALESENMLGRQIRHGETVISLTNYKEYSGSQPNEKDSDMDRGGTEAGQRRDKVQEDKEGKKREERAPAPASEWSEHHPSGTASEFDRVTKRINDCNPQWRKAMTRIEMDTLQANARFIFVLTDADWCLVRAYMHAMIPEHLGKFYQPNSRQRFIQEISDVLGHADRWKSACRRAGIPTGIEPQKTA